VMPSDRPAEVMPHPCYDLPRLRPGGAPGPHEGARDVGGSLTLHRECTSGQAWHMPLVIKPETRPALCDCQPEA
jgi:hypothetical protein